jgi:lactate permease
VGPALVDIIASAVSIGATYVLLQFWQPKKNWRFPGEDEGKVAAHKVPSSAAAWKAWMPWLILSVIVFIWGTVTVKTWLNGISSFKWAVPNLHNLVLKAPPIAPKPTPEGAIYLFNWLSATGTALLLTGIISGLILKLSPGKAAPDLREHIEPGEVLAPDHRRDARPRLHHPVLGLRREHGARLRRDRRSVPLLLPHARLAGVALTGSDTSSNVLFGNLQKVSPSSWAETPI